MKTYCIKYRYEGINDSEFYEIISKIIKANTAREAIEKLIEEEEKENDCKVTEIHAVFQLIEKPRGGWLANAEEKDK